MKPIISLTRAMKDPGLFGPIFAAPTFWPWFAVAKLLDGEPLDSREADLFHECTGRSRVPTQPVQRLILLVGRRGGKDRFTSAATVHRSALAANWAELLSPGEQAVCVLIGTDKKQARILRRYCAGLLANPLIAAEIVRNTSEMIEFKNGAALEIASNDAALIRGRSAIGIAATEVCHWQTDDTKSSSDEEVVAAAEPAMAMTPGGGLLLMQSSVYRRQGYMHRRYKELHGNDDAEDVCWLATSQQMNPALPAKVVEDALARDPARADAEFNSRWRDDISSLMSRALLDSSIDRGVIVRPPRRDLRYFAYIDASTGVGKDSFTAAISHRDGDELIVDALYERRPPFSAQSAMNEVAELVKSYHLVACTGDRFAAGFVAEGLSRCGVKFSHCERDTSANYIEALGAFTSGRVRLLDNQRLVSQFLSLERRTTIGGRDRVDHGRGDRHDDLAAACAGAIVLAALRKAPISISDEALAAVAAYRPSQNAWFPPRPVVMRF